jgi:hypothetical protein
LRRQAFTPFPRFEIEIRRIVRTTPFDPAPGSGLAGELLGAVTGGASDGCSWLLTSIAPRAMAFYRRQGLAQAPHPSPDGKGIVVFLGPRHPARQLVPLPL